MDKFDEGNIYIQNVREFLNGNFTLIFNEQKKIEKFLPQVIKKDINSDNPYISNLCDCFIAIIKQNEITITTKITPIHITTLKNALIIAGEKSLNKLEETQIKRKKISKSDQNETKEIEENLDKIREAKNLIEQIVNIIIIAYSKYQDD